MPGMLWGARGIRERKRLLELVILTAIAALGFVFAEALGRVLVVLFPLAVGAFFIAMLAYSVISVVVAVAARGQKPKWRALGFVLGLVGMAMFGLAVGSMIFGEDATVDGLRRFWGWARSSGGGAGD